MNLIEQATIIIPTRGRVGLQKTLAALPSTLAERAWLACPESEAELHDWPRLMVHPEDLESEGGMGAKRQWMMDKCETPVLVMLDDDLKFMVRAEGVRLVEASEQDTIDALEWMIGQCLGGFTQSGISSRGGNNRVPQFSKENTRSITEAFAVNVQEARSRGLRWRLPLLEDIDFVLQVLRSGGSNSVAYHWCVAQKANAKGGCSLFRTSKKQTSCARKLAKLHPGFVKVIVKKAGTWPGMGAFCDVRISWIKAAESA